MSSSMNIKGKLTDLVRCWSLKMNEVFQEVCKFTARFVRVNCKYCSTEQYRYLLSRGKSLLESWFTTFLPDRQPPLIFVSFTSKSPLEHMHKKFEINQTKIKGSCQSERKVVTREFFASNRYISHIKHLILCKFCYCYLVTLFSR